MAQVIEAALQSSSWRPAQPPVRVHVEEGVQGLTVWLGIDGEPAAWSGLAASLLTNLRRSLQGQGQRLAAVVCNGITIYRDDPPVPESHHFKEP